MKNMRRAAAILMVILITMSGMSAFAAKETVSDAFRLPAVKVRPTETEAPAETEPAETEPVEAEPVETTTMYVDAAANNGSDVNVRTEANGGSVITTLAAGTAVQVVESGSEWTAILINGETGYIRTDYLSDTAPVAETTETPKAEEAAPALIEEQAAAVRTSENGANIREAADGLSLIMATVPADTEVDVLEYVNSDWAKIAYDGVAGYVHKTELVGASFPEEEPAEDDALNVKVTIFTSRTTVMQPGETIVLTSYVEGADDYDVEYQWECDKGAGFEEVEGADADSYSYEASKETLSWSWRLAVYCYEKD